jgi:hypothetical protein
MGARHALDRGAMSIRHGSRSGNELLQSQIVQCYQGGSRSAFLGT